jgi:3-methyladenine DNA glycosylase AlkD
MWDDDAVHCDLLVGKAIGWVLREFAKTAPYAVRAYLRPMTRACPGAA